MQCTQAKFYNKNKHALWKLCVRAPCHCTRSLILPLSLAVDGSSNAICSANSDRESSTGRALRRDMDSLRLMIFILSIFSVPPPGAHHPEREATNITINHHQHHLHPLPNHYSHTLMSSELHTPSFMSTVQRNNETTAVQSLLHCSSVWAEVVCLTILHKYIRINQDKCATRVLKQFQWTHLLAKTRQIIVDSWKSQFHRRKYTRVSQQCCNTVLLAIRYNLLACVAF